MANLGILVVSAGLAVVAGAALFAVAARRARAIEAGPCEQRAHELRVLARC